MVSIHPIIPLSITLPINISFCQPLLIICVLFNHLSVYQFIYICRSIYLYQSIYMSSNLIIYLSNKLITYRSINLSIFLSISLSIFWLSIWLFRLYIYLSVYIRECQKKDWPSHKEVCKVTRIMLTFPFRNQRI